MSGELQDSEGFVAVGRVLKPRAIRGEAFLAPLTDDSEWFQELEEVLIQRPDGTRSTLRVESVRTYGKRLGIKFREFNTPEDVARLRGSLLLVPQDALRPLPEGEFYVSQIIGLSVETESGESVGRVVDVLSLPGNDVYVVDREGKEVLLPAVRELMRVDIAAGRVVVCNIEGLL